MVLSLFLVKAEYNVLWNSNFALRNISIYPCCFEMTTLRRVVSQRVATAVVSGAAATAPLPVASQVVTTAGFVCRSVLHSSHCSFFTLLISPIECDDSWKRRAAVSCSEDGSLPGYGAV